MKRTELFFPFEPKPKGRPRFTRTGHAYTPKTTHDYEKLIRDFYTENTEDFYEDAIQIKLTFYMPIPKSTTKRVIKLIDAGIYRYTKKPDLDNLVKAFQDGLNGIAFEDDSLITKISAEKKYTDSEVGTLMIITEDVE